MKTDVADLLVVGLGPVGAVLAGLTKLDGLSVIAIDREPDIYPLPRAAVFDQEIMRIFQRLGVAERIAPLCRVPPLYRFVTGRGETLLEFSIDIGPGKWGWAETYALHQPGVERAIRDRLTELSVDIRPLTHFRSSEQDTDGVTAQVEGPDGEYTIRAGALVGCDGAWSLVREEIGAKLFDYQFDEPWLVLDTLVKDGGDLPQICMQICDPERPTTFMRMSGERYRWEFMLKPGEDQAELLTDAAIDRLLAPWNVIDRIEIERRAVYRFHGLVADRWRAGRTLIAGDAAHQMPPFAGQGMCSGIRDAANLSWKLGVVARGEADPGLLDTYRQEREPHVRAILETAIAMGKVVCLLDPQAAAERNAGMLARKAAGAQDVSIEYPPLAEGLLLGGPESGELFIQPMIDGRRLDDVLGAGAWLLADDLPKDLPRGLNPFQLRSPRLGAFSPAIEAWLSARGAAAVLVRPDRHVFGLGNPKALAEAWRDGLAGRAEADVAASAA